MNNNRPNYTLLSIVIGIILGVVSVAFLVLGIKLQEKPIIIFSCAFAVPAILIPIFAIDDQKSQKLYKDFDHMAVLSAIAAVMTLFVAIQTKDKKNFFLELIIFFFSIGMVVFRLNKKKDAPIKNNDEKEQTTENTQIQNLPDKKDDLHCPVCGMKLKDGLFCEICGYMNR